FLGRASTAAVIQRFAQEGAWGVSPHHIPHRSLHSLSGTVSQALEIHGPNYGVGGGPNSAAEVLLAAAAMLADRKVPGVWVVLTGWDPELVPENPLAPVPDGAAAIPECGAVALALAPISSRWEGPRLQVNPAATPRSVPFEAPRFRME